MLRVWWLAIAVFLTLVLAPRAVQAAEPQMPDLSTPEKAFEAWRAAVVAGDKTAEYRCYDARSQEMAVVSYLNAVCYFIALTSEISGDHPIHEHVVEAQQILKRHKVDLAVFREYENLPKPKGAVDAGARKEVAEAFEKWLSRLNQGIDDRPGLCGELSRCIERASLTLQKERQQEELAAEKEKVLPLWQRLTIADVKLNDDRAEVTVTGFPSGNQVLTFRKCSDEWLLAFSP